MLKVGIIGCGKIADSHASQIRRIEGCEIVAACDSEPLMAGQFCDRFGIPLQFGSAEQLLDAARPDVVHVTTPPASHFGLAVTCLERGAHLYLEKPFALDAPQTHAILRLAEAKGCKVTVGHDEQFSHVAQRLREQVRIGYLGGPPVHMESTFCYVLDQVYARALLADRNHWVRRLPGKLLHNIISHGVARVAEFLVSDSPEVIAHGTTSPFLRALGEREIVDELRVIIADPQGNSTAYFTFSSQMRPTIHQFAIYGPRNGLSLDQDHELLLKLKGGRYKSFADKFVPPANLAGQQIRNLAHNFNLFLRRDFHARAGMYHLIKAFYESIRSDQPVPIPYREIALTATIMDSIFRQVGGGTSCVPTPE